MAARNETTTSTHEDNESQTLPEQLRAEKAESQAFDPALMSELEQLRAEKAAREAEAAAREEMRVRALGDYPVVRIICTKRCDSFSINGRRGGPIEVDGQYDVLEPFADLLVEGGYARKIGS